MINPTDYEAIGHLAQDYIVADIKRINARNVRGKERASHPCVWQVESNEAPCWQLVHYFDSGAFKHRSEWCDNCQHVQPYYEAYQLAAKKARIARYRLSRRIQAKMLSESED